MAIFWSVHHRRQVTGSCVLRETTHMGRQTSIYLSIYLSIDLPTYLSIYLPTYLPTYLPNTCLLSIYISVYLSISRRPSRRAPSPSSTASATSAASPAPSFWATCTTRSAEVTTLGLAHRPRAALATGPGGLQLSGWPFYS